MYIPMSGHGAKTIPMHVIVISQSNDSMLLLMVTSTQVALPLGKTTHTIIYSSILINIHE